MVRGAGNDVIGLLLQCPGVNVRLQSGDANHSPLPRNSCIRRLQKPAPPARPFCDASQTRYNRGNNLDTLDPRICKFNKLSLVGYKLRNIQPSIISASKMKKGLQRKCYKNFHKNTLFRSEGSQELALSLRPSLRHSRMFSKQRITV